MSAQLNEIMHNQQFQRLEATWRGLKYLLEQSETNSLLKIRILNASKKELLRDLQRAPEFDQSAMFKKVYEDEYGLFGGEPFGALVGDYDLAALCPTRDGLYRRLGWRYWRGPLSVRKDGHVVPTPQERVMILPLPLTPTLDLDAPLSVEWRPGEVW